MSQTLIVDADSHVSEARDVWTARMSRKKWGDLIPEIRLDEETQKEAWFVGSNRMAFVYWSGTFNVDPETGERARTPYNEKPARMEDLHPSCYDANERLKVMDEVGVYAAALYPNVNTIHNDIHTAITDPEFKLDSIKAYNDWLVEWSSVAPERLLPMALVAHFDARAAADEVYRAKEIGHRGLVMTGVPQLHGEPYLADRHWDPLWSAAQETGLPISFHLGTGPKPGAHQDVVRQGVEGRTAFSTRAVVDMFLGDASSCADLLMSGVLPRYPNLKFVCAEGGIGWVNFVLETLDYHFEKLEVAKTRPEYEELPSYYFHRQVYATYWFENMAQFHVDRIGGDRILFETDYPHTTSLERSDIDRAIDDGLAAVAEDVRENILWRNAAQLYGIDVPQVPTA